MLAIATTNFIRSTQANPPQMQMLMLVGFLASFAAIVCWMYRRQSSELLAGLGLSLAVLAVYGFLDGVWPLGIVQGIWSIATLRQWWAGPQKVKRTVSKIYGECPVHHWESESRISRLFGPMSH